MKKQIMLVAAIAVMGLGMFLGSCKKDEPKVFKGCTCTEVYYDGSRDTFTVSASEVQGYGATSCSQVAGLQMAWGGGDITSVNCTDL